MKARDWLRTRYPLGRICYTIKKKDLKGKDAFRGNSQSYAWLANQLGHFAIGFFGVMIVNLAFILLKLFFIAFLCFLQISTLDCPLYAVLEEVDQYLLSAIISIVIILNMEFSFLNNTLRKIENFPDLKMGFLFLDIVIDILYFIAGIALSYIVLRFDFEEDLGWWSVLVVVVLLVFIFLTLIEYNKRINIDDAKFPIRFNILMKDKGLSEENVDIVKNYFDKRSYLTDNRAISNDYSPLDFYRYQLSEFEAYLMNILKTTSHAHITYPLNSALLICGPSDSGKTHLAVGMGTYLVNHHKKVTYTTCAKYNFNEKELKVKEKLDYFIIDDCPLKDASKLLMNWMDAEFDQYNLILVVLTDSLNLEDLLEYSDEVWDEQSKNLNIDIVHTQSIDL